MREKPDSCKLLRELSILFLTWIPLSYGENLEYPNLVTTFQDFSLVMLVGILRPQMSRLNWWRETGIAQWDNFAEGTACFFCSRCRRGRSTGRMDSKMTCSKTHYTFYQCHKESKTKLHICSPATFHGPKTKSVPGSKGPIHDVSSQKEAPTIGKYDGGR